MLAVARPNWTYVEKKVEAPKDVPLIAKVQKPKKSENEVKAEQADWIKRYMAQQAEVTFFSKFFQVLSCTVSLDLQIAQWVTLSSNGIAGLGGGRVGKF